MKKVFFAVIIWCIPSVLFSQVLTQRFAKGEAVEKGVKIINHGVSDLFLMKKVEKDATVFNYLCTFALL